MIAAIAALGWLAAVAGFVIAWCALAELARRRELVARACHELRGPLAAATLALHGVARDGQAPARRVAAVELELRRAGLALDDLAAARGGRRRADRDEVVDVAELLACQVDAWSDVARAYGCELRLGSMPRDAIVVGNGLRLAQATANLIANAVEHGRGPIQISVRRAGARIRIEVSDDGPGLPAPVAELVGRPRAGRGARGRGLAIAAEIAARHGGRVAAAPAPRGARIAIELPTRGGAA
jgi:signal transduction histidine kinase